MRDIHYEHIIMLVITLYLAISSTFSFDSHTHTPWFYLNWGTFMHEIDAIRNDTFHISFFPFRKQNEAFTILRAKHKARTHIRTPPITMRRSNFQGPFFLRSFVFRSHPRNYLIQLYEYNGCDRKRIETACSRRLTWTNQLRSTVFCLSINWQIKSLLLTMRFRPFKYSEWLALLQFI